LSNGIATLPAQGGSLATGSNSIVATYGGNNSFSGSAAAPVIVIVAAPAIATMTGLTVNPGVIAQNSAAILTATVTAASGSAAPTGSISFSTGNRPLGSAAITAFGATGTALLQVEGSSLGVGQNSITASYTGAGNFANSSSSVTVNVTASPIATTLALAVSPGARASTIVLTVTVRAAGGNAIPTGSVTFARGSTLLGSAVLTQSGTGATGTLTLNDSNLSPGSNMIVATYGGNTAFSRSTASIILDATSASVAARRSSWKP
jgi:hypothetical protein